MSYLNAAFNQRCEPQMWQMVFLPGLDGIQLSEEGNVPTRFHTDYWNWKRNSNIVMIRNRKTISNIPLYSLITHLVAARAVKFYHLS